MSEHTNTHKYDYGRFRIRTESDYAIIDELGEIPPIMITSNSTFDGSEPMYADKSTVLHCLNELADNNHDEHKFWYLRYRLDTVQSENEYLRKKIKDMEEKLGVDLE